MTYMREVAAAQQEPSLCVGAGKEGATHHQHCKVGQVVAEAGRLRLSPDGLTAHIAPAPGAAH